MKNLWWYIGLTAVVFAAYWATSSSHPGRPLKMRSVTPAIGQAAEEPLWTQPMDTQRAKALLEQRPALASLVSFWTLLAMALAVGGVWLSAWAVARGALARAWRFPSKLAVAWSWQDAAWILWLVILIAGLLPLAHLSLSEAGLLPWAGERIWTVVAMGLLDVLVVLIIWSFASRRVRSSRLFLGAPGPARWRAVREGLGAYVACFPWMFALLWAALMAANALGIEPQVEAIHELLFAEERPQTLVLTAVLACLIGPVAEEFFFRGMVFGLLRRHASRGLAVAASSALFAAMHTNLVGFLPIFALGGLLAVVYERSGSLAGPIAVHVAHNTFLVGIGMTARELLL